MQPDSPPPHPPQERRCVGRRHASDARSRGPPEPGHQVIRTRTRRSCLTTGRRTFANAARRQQLEVDGLEDDAVLATQHHPFLRSRPTGDPIAQRPQRVVQTLGRDRATCTHPLRRRHLPLVGSAAVGLGEEQVRVDLDTEGIGPPFPDLVACGGHPTPPEPAGAWWVSAGVVESSTVDRNDDTAPGNP